MIYVMVLLVVLYAHLLYRVYQAERNFLEYKIAIHRDIMVPLKEREKKYQTVLEKVFSELASLYNNQVFLQRMFNEMEHPKEISKDEKTKLN